MPQKQDLISFQASTMTAPLKQITEDYGDYLELLSACEKLHLLSVLAFWQALDTELSEESVDPDSIGCEAYGLANATEDYAAELTSNTLGALKSLEGLTDQACLDLMVAISCQLRNGVFQQ